MNGNNRTLRSDEERRDQYAFTFACLLLTCLGLAIIWIPAFPAMQDYPQHLFMSYVISSFHDSNLNWAEYYSINPHYLQPYSLFYAVVTGLAHLFPIFIAGKIFISCALLSVTAVIIVWNRAADRKFPAWSLLLLLPLFFSQAYYMGFTNYLFSIPLLFLSLYVHEGFFKNNYTHWRVIIYSILLFLLFLSHPYTILSYFVFVGVLSLSQRHTRKAVLGNLIPPLVLAALFSLWLLREFHPTITSSSGIIKIHWWPLMATLRYFLLPFTGMKISQGIDPIALLLWVSVIFLFLLALIKQRKIFKVNPPITAMLSISILGYLILPFWIGNYSYFNLRLTIIIYFLTAIFLANVQIRRQLGYLLTILLSGILFISFQTQATLSDELEESLPILDKIPSGALVYPLYVDSSSSAIDRVFFRDFHIHTHFYHYILTDSGVSPFMFQSSISPVILRDDFRLPPFRKYPYVLVRGELPPNKPLEGNFSLLTESKNWHLYENKSVQEKP